MKLNVDDAVEITQAGEAWLPGESHGGQEQKQKPFHGASP
jgi:hypothetical protein